MLSLGNNRGGDVDRKVIDGRVLNRDEEQFYFVSIEIQVVCRHPLRDVTRHAEMRANLGFRQRRSQLFIICVAVVGQRKRRDQGLTPVGPH